MSMLISMVFLVCLPGGAWSGLSGREMRDVRRFISHAMQCRGVPGLSIAIVQNNATVLSEGFGLADIENAIPATDNTLFCIASLTKAFTATLLGKLLHKHGMTWDTAVQDIMGHNFKFADEYRSKHVTVRDLLVHRTGLPRYDYLWIGDHMSTHDILSKIGCMKESDGFRSNAVYNNIMYSLAGHLTERLEGKSYEQLISQELLRPLGMKHTRFQGNVGGQERNLASQYGYNMHKRRFKLQKDRFGGARNISPAIGMCSSAKDMSKWLSFHLREGTNEQDSRVVDRDILKETYKPEVLASKMYWPEMERPSTPVTHTYDMYGMGWFVGYYRGYKTWMHYGSFPGFYSLITLVPSQSLAIYSAINGGQQGLPYTINSVIHTYIMDLAFKETPWLTPETACSFANQDMDYNVTLAYDKSRSPLHPEAEYSGTYYNAVFGNLTVESRHNGLFMKYGKMEFQLFAEEGNMFNAEPTDKQWMMLPEQVTFNRKYKNSGVIMDIEVPFLERRILPVFLKLPQGVSARNWRMEIDRSCVKKSPMSLCSSGAFILSDQAQIYTTILLISFISCFY